MVHYLISTVTMFDVNNVLVNAEININYHE